MSRNPQGPWIAHDSGLATHDSMKNHNQTDTPDWAQKFRTDLRALLLKNLDESPLFRRICRQAVGFESLNSNQSKNLAKNNFIFRGPDQMPSTPAKPPKQESFKNVRTCQHIKVTGVPCGGPPMRGEQFCYFHQRMLRGVKTPPNVRIHPVALIEDEESIQASLMEIINALARNHIDLRRADLMLKALWIAVKNSRRAKFNINNSQMAREIPDYPAPPNPAPRPEPAAAINETPPYIAKRRVKNAIAQLQSRALGDLPVPAAASDVRTDAGTDVRTDVNPGVRVDEMPGVSAPPPAPVRVPARTAPAKIPAIPETTPPQVAQLDPTQRKHPTRAGTPSTIKRAAVNQGRHRT